MYWCSPLPACRLPPAEGYNLLSFSRLSWKGPPTPFALVLAKILVRRRRPTIFSPPGTTFHPIFILDPLISLKHIINQSSESPKHQINTYTRIIYVLAPRSSPSDHINMSHYDPDPILVLIHQY